jgi:hypothetical protein
MTDTELLEKYGWVVECESPFEIRHNDGSFASIQGADCVLDSCKREENFEKYLDFCETKKKEKELKPSGWGIVVDKSEAKETYPLRTTKK